MNRAILAALVGASAVATPAAAQEPAAALILAPGEVLLEVDGVGRTRTAATVATITVSATGEGRTIEEARRRRDSDVERIVAAARAAGAADSDISVGPVSFDEALTTFDVEEPPPPEIGASIPEPREYATSSVTIRLHRADRARELHDRVIHEGGDSIAPPVYELVDDREARREARRLAVADATEDAEAYAAALGMRVVRTVRVTERAGLDFLSMAVTERYLAQRFARADTRADAQVETQAVVGVDFVLARR